MSDPRRLPQSTIRSRFEGMRLDRLRSSVRDARPGVGFDFGTSNSAAAIFDGHEVTVVQLEESGSIMPSASYIDSGFSVATGEQAIRTYIDSNRGRRVEFSAEVLGEARTSTGHIDQESGIPSNADTETIYGSELTDAGLPGRLFFGIKRLLGNRDNGRVVIFNRPFRLVALVTPLVLRMLRSTRRALRDRADDTQHGCIGHPVDFEGDGREHNQIALDRLSEAYRHAGVAEQRFCPEPIAAAISYLHANPVDRPRRVLSVDFGGGTLDLCLIRCGDTDMEVEAVHGIALGGNKIDQAVFRELLFPLLGKGAQWKHVQDGREVETQFPFWMYEERLLNWQVTYTLNQNKYTTPLIGHIETSGAESVRLRRLYQLIADNAGFEVFQAIKKAKERLSTEVAVELDIPEIDVNVDLQRPQFEAMIAGPLAEFEQAVQTILDNAQLDASQIDLVLRTGGSALIPAFAAILDRHFPGKVVEHDPFTSVAAGLAIADYHRLGGK